MNEGCSPALPGGGFLLRKSEMRSLEFYSEKRDEMFAVSFYNISYAGCFIV